MARAGPLIAAAGGQKEIAAVPGTSLAPAVRRKFSIACLLAAWVCANGMVWNVVQVVAWARMFQQFSQVMPAARALQVTFSGEAPCPLCKLSQTAQDNERKQLPPDAALGGATEKILFLADSAPAPLVIAPESSWPGVVDAAGLTRTESVPVPPPRV